MNDLVIPNTGVLTISDRIRISAAWQCVAGRDASQGQMEEFTDAKPLCKRGIGIA